MKITFIKDHASVLSGNSAYKENDQADLRRGHELVECGAAVEGWRTLGISYTDSLQDEITPSLRQIAKAKNIKGYGRMKRETLIKRILEHVDN